jgi:excisionase family DNA binding protein
MPSPVSSPASDATAAPQLLSVDDVAQLLSCSPHHVYRMADVGRMPQPVKLGALVRWRRTDLDNWLAAGCPTCDERGA